jgi:hypothetical protein
MNEEIEHDISTWSYHKREVVARFIMSFMWKIKIKPFKEFSYTRSPDGTGEHPISHISYIKKQR